MRKKRSAVAKRKIECVEATEQKAVESPVEFHAQCRATSSITTKRRIQCLGPEIDSVIEYNGCLLGFLSEDVNKVFGKLECLALDGDFKIDVDSVYGQKYDEVVFRRCIVLAGANLSENRSAELAKCTLREIAEVLVVSIHLGCSAVFLEDITLFIVKNTEWTLDELDSALDVMDTISIEPLGTKDVTQFLLICVMSMRLNKTNDHIPLTSPSHTNPFRWRFRALYMAVAHQDKSDRVVWDNALYLMRVWKMTKCDLGKCLISFSRGNGSIDEWNKAGGSPALPKGFWPDVSEVFRQDCVLPETSKEILSVIQRLTNVNAPNVGSSAVFLSCARNQFNFPDGDGLVMRESDDLDAVIAHAKRSIDQLQSDDVLAVITE